MVYVYRVHTCETENATLPKPFRSPCGLLRTCDNRYIFQSSMIQQVELCVLYFRTIKRRRSVVSIPIVSHTRKCLLFSVYYDTESWWGGEGEGGGGGCNIIDLHFLILLLLWDGYCFKVKQKSKKAALSKRPVLSKTRHHRIYIFDGFSHKETSHNRKCSRGCTQGDQQQ